MNAHCGNVCGHSFLPFKLSHDDLCYIDKVERINKQTVTFEPKGLTDACLSLSVGQVF